MEIFLIKLLQFMLSISLLVLLHEGGHFFFARLFGVRVEKFYLFFDPWFHLFEFKPKNSETTYGIGWLPLGGYCKISGMIDESFDTEQMKQPAQPWEFRSRPAWQRLFIMIGGVLVNFLLALFIYSMILFHWGDTYVPLRAMDRGFDYNQTAQEVGFCNGDLPIRVDGKEFDRYGLPLIQAIAEGDVVTVLRDGQEVELTMPESLDLMTMVKEDPPFMRPSVPAVVDSVMDGSPARQAGLRAGDRIVAVGGSDVHSWNAFNDVMGLLSDALSTAKTAADSLRLRTVNISFAHQGDTAVQTAVMVLTADLKAGVFYSPYQSYYKDKVYTREYSLVQSIPAGISYGLDILGGYVSQMKYVFTADGAKSLGGFGAIGNMFPATWDWHAFWLMTAFLSIILAFMNILPIPALDGGHVLFLLYEIIFRRKPSDDFMVKAEYVGFGILMLLLIVANMNDVLRWLGVM